MAQNMCWLLEVSTSCSYRRTPMSCITSAKNTCGALATRLSAPSISTIPTPRTDYLLRSVQLHQGPTACRSRVAAGVNPRTPPRLRLHGRCAERASRAPPEPVRDWRRLVIGRPHCAARTRSTRAFDEPRRGGRFNSTGLPASTPSPSAPESVPRCVGMAAQALRNSAQVLAESLPRPGRNPRTNCGRNTHPGAGITDDGCDWRTPRRLRDTGAIAFPPPRTTRYPKRLD